ncbi:hypothetical protein ABZY81_42725 [Streptomyces sp. NPDC006514]|uniref:hypothetical protein n=1 Tax=Streptomyces sp. NPDC006514 TaxID=3154308 RepID=UPI0033AA494F
MNGTRGPSMAMMVALVLLPLATACSANQEASELSPPAKVLTSENLRLAALSRTDLPAGYELRGTGKAMERANTVAKVNAANCQPIADIYSTNPAVTRRARTGQEMYDFGSHREDWYHIYLDAYGSAGDAKKALTALRDSVGKCQGFRIGDGLDFKSVSKALAPEAGDEALAFQADYTMYNIVRVGTVLAVFEGDDVRSGPGHGVVSPTLVQAQTKKLQRVMDQS